METSPNHLSGLENDRFMTMVTDKKKSNIQPKNAKKNVLRQADFLRRGPSFEAIRSFLPEFWVPQSGGCTTQNGIPLG